MTLTEDQIEGFRIVLANQHSRDHAEVQERWDALCDMALSSLDGPKTLPEEMARRRKVLEMDVTEYIDEGQRQGYLPEETARLVIDRVLEDGLSATQTLPEAK